MRAMLRIAAALLALATLGCAHTPATRPAGLSDDTRAGLGRVGLIVAAPSPEIEMSTPPGRLDAAAKGAAKGTLVMLAAGGYGHWVGGVIAIGLSPAAAAVGALIGAGWAEPVANANELASAIRTAMHEQDLAALLRDAVQDVVSERTGRALTLVPGAAESGPDAPARDRDLGDQPIDTVLEIAVTAVRLTPEAIPFLDHKSNPDFSLVVTARARLVRVADGAELDVRTVTADAGGMKGFASWGSDGAAEIRGGLQRAARHMAEDIAGELFGGLPGPAPGIIPPP